MAMALGQPAHDGIHLSFRTRLPEARSQRRASRSYSPRALLYRIP
jgi:hypothetical protein